MEVTICASLTNATNKVLLTHSFHTLIMVKKAPNSMREVRIVTICFVEILKAGVFVSRSMKYLKLFIYDRTFKDNRVCLTFL